MVPCSVAKMNLAGNVVPCKTNPVPPLKTVPVGTEFAGGVTITCWRPSGRTLTPAPLYRVANPVPLSETQNGVAPWEIPQGLTRSASTNAAGGRPRLATAAGLSVTRSVIWYAVA